MSSQSAALALPTPGPATVRLSLIRASIELYGEAITRDSVFPIVRAMPIQIRPPEYVAMSVQNVRHYKTKDHPDHGVVFEESLGYREYSVAQGDLVIYAEIPESAFELLLPLFKLIGYWGQTNSFAYCVSVKLEAPIVGECALPLNELPPNERAYQRYSSLVTEFKEPTVTWEQMLSGDTLLKQLIYVWPLILCERRSGHTLFRHCSLSQKGASATFFDSDVRL